MLKLEARPQPSSAWSYGSPLLALLCTVVIGVILFMLLGKDPVRGLQVFFLDPREAVDEVPKHARATDEPRTGRQHLGTRLAVVGPQLVRRSALRRPRV